MKTGYHAVYEDDFFSAIDNAKKHNFQFVQYDISVPGFDPERMSYDELIRIRNHAYENDVTLSFHCPGIISFYIDQTHVRKGISDYYQSLLQKLDILNARHITVHLGDYDSFKIAGKANDEYLRRHGDYFSNVLYENMMRLLDFENKVMICIENCNMDTFKLNTLEKLINDSSQLFLTFDIAKAYNRDQNLNAEVYDFMNRHIDRIKEVHVHDCNLNGSHQSVGTGFVDFKLFRHFLLKQDVYINYEVRPLEEAIRSRSNLEKIIRTPLENR